ncbi:EamA family transporter RarD [Thalassotalea marina]|uniref:EamA family transporter RarD n=1 Tax=Thalassotalea marina TaxID=1673741 RepID=UPI0036DB7320
MLTFTFITPETNIVQNNEQKLGVVNAIAAYLMWGLAPIYFKTLESVNADEIMVHRVVWSSVLLLLFVFATARIRAVISTLVQPGVLIKLTISACFLGFNWFLFIWAVNNDHILDASLGYYINPLFNVALGMVFLNERLRKWQLVAVLLAVIGVLIQVVTLGELPIISLALAGSFAIYGLIRKKLQVNSIAGLLIESSVMLPIALLYWLWFVNSSTSNMAENSLSLNLLFVFAGIVTTAPLLCFTAAAKRLTLSTVGFFQYIGPSIMFVLATFYYDEPLEPSKLVTFGFIWLALVIYSADSMKTYRKLKV